MAGLSGFVFQELTPTIPIVGATATTIFSVLQFIKAVSKGLRKPAVSRRDAMGRDANDDPSALAVGRVREGDFAV